MSSDPQTPRPDDPSLRAQQADVLENMSLMLDRLVTVERALALRAGASALRELDEYHALTGEFLDANTHGIAAIHSLQAQIESLQQQLTDLRERHENFKANEARTREHYLARVTSAEQQLTAARAQVLAQVKALLRTEQDARFHQASSVGHGHPQLIETLIGQLDALQPDLSLAVISEADREQAQAHYLYAGEHFYRASNGRPSEDDELREAGKAALAEARSLLHLPQEPK